MTGEKNTVESGLQTLNAYLDYRGMRMTAERRMILEAVYAYGTPITVDSLCQRLDQEKCHIATATAYSAVKLLCECGILCLVHDQARQQSYEFAGRPKMRCVCRVCGKVRQLRDAEAEAFLKGRRFGTFTVEQISLTVSGMCSTCARKRRKAANSKNSKQDNK